MTLQKNRNMVMIILFSSLFAYLFLLQIFAAAESEGDSESEGDKVTKKFLNNVVRLKVTFAKKSDPDYKEPPGAGFGFVVGENRERDILYVVTADHVLKSKEKDPDITTESISAWFEKDKGNEYAAKRLKLNYQNDVELDLALLDIPKPFGSYTWEKKYYSSPQKNQKVWFIGRNEDWWVPPDNKAGTIEEISTTGYKLTVSIDSILPGTSGAPLIAAEGIVGMIYEDTSQGEATALSIETIKKVVTECWNYPWDLQDFHHPTELDGAKMHPLILRLIDVGFPSLIIVSLMVTRVYFDGKIDGLEIDELGRSKKCLGAPNPEECNKEMLAKKNNYERWKTISTLGIPLTGVIVYSAWLKLLRPHTKLHPGLDKQVPSKISVTLKPTPGALVFQLNREF